MIAGEYFGWNLGLPAGESLGLTLAFLLVTVMYVTFVFSYAELACVIPRAGGGFVYGLRGLGRFGGYMTGVAQAIEFAFAPPAIAMAVGANVQVWRPEIDQRAVALGCYRIFTLLNIWGVKQALHFLSAVDSTRRVGVGVGGACGFCGGAWRGGRRAKNRSADTAFAGLCGDPRETGGGRECPTASPCGASVVRR